MSFAYLWIKNIYVYDSCAAAALLSILYKHCNLKVYICSLKTTDLTTSILACRHLEVKVDNDIIFVEISTYSLRQHL